MKFKTAVLAACSGLLLLGCSTTATDAPVEPAHQAEELRRMGEPAVARNAVRNAVCPTNVRGHVSNFLSYGYLVGGIVLAYCAS